VIFDIDGTLVDSSSFDGQLYIAAIRDVLGDVSMRADLHEYPNHTDTGILMEICKENGLSIVIVMPSVRQRFGKLVTDYLSSGGECSPISGAICLLDRLIHSDEFQVGIATGGWGHTARMKLDQAGINYDGIPIVSSDVEYERIKIMEACRFRISSPGNTVYVGDGEWDKRATEQLGWKFVGVGSRLRGKCQNWAPDLTAVSESDF